MTKDEIAKLIEETTDIAIEKAEKRSDARMQRYIGAISEDSNHKVAAVAEQYLGLSKKLDGVIQTVDETNTKVDSLTSSAVHVEEILEEVSNTTNATFEEVGAIRMEMTENNQRIAVLEQKVR